MTTETTPARTRLRDLPPSAKLVYLVLDNEGPLTQRTLSDRTMLSTRTVRHAVGELETADLVRTDVYMPDPRKRLYRLAGHPDGTE